MIDLKLRRQIKVLRERTYVGTAAPSSGHWNVGDRVCNISASVGDATGWVCTVAGYPGTWVSEGTLNPNNLIFYFQ